MRNAHYFDIGNGSSMSFITSYNWNISAIQYENVYGIFEEPKTDNLNDIFWLDNIE